MSRNAIVTLQVNHRQQEYISTQECATLCSRLVSVADVEISHHVIFGHIVRAERTGWSHARLCVLPIVHFQNLLTCSLHAISTPVCTGSYTTANLLQTGTTDPKSRDVKFRRRRPDMQSCTLLGAYILLVLNKSTWTPCRVLRTLADRCLVITMILENQNLILAQSR